MKQLRGAAASFPPSAANLVFEAPRVTDTLEFELTVTDYRGDSTQRSVVIDVFLNNRPPIVVLEKERVVAGGELVALDASRSADPDGDELAYNWYRQHGPLVTLEKDAGDPIARFVAPEPGVEPIFMRFGVVVSDGTDESFGWTTITVQP